MYDGSTAAVVTLSDDRVSGDVLTTSYGTAAFATKDAGSRTATVSGITVVGPDASNYSANAGATADAVITPRPITITADAKAKQFGAADPALTYQLTSGSLVAGELLAGSLSRVAGETVGPHAITQGTVLAGPNYALGFIGGTLTIGAWHATGFYAPVGVDSSVFQPASTSTVLPAASASTVWNTAKGGSTVPLKFNLFTGRAGAERTGVADVKGFTVTPLTCPGSVLAADEVDFVTAGSTVLRYDATDKQFIQNWKTPSVTKDSCYRVSVVFTDQSSISSFFRLRK